jgi:drug/metabolite transporter (DMT)-like permease
MRTLILVIIFSILPIGYTLIFYAINGVPAQLWQPFSLLIIHEAMLFISDRLNITSSDMWGLTKKVWNA